MSATDLDDGEVHRDVQWGDPNGRGLAIGMVVGLDGGVSINGRSGALGGPGDAAAFRALRAAADVVLVGAGTARAENYGPVVRRDEAAGRRLARGQSDVAQLAVVSSSLELDVDGRLFEDASRPPIIITHEDADAGRVSRLEAAGAQIVRSGEQSVRLDLALQALADRGLRRVLCEGGPALNAALLSADLVDDLFVTLAPVVTGSAHHLVPSASLSAPVGLELVGVIGAGAELLLHHRVAR